MKKGYKTEWDLKRLYKSIDDPQLEKDVQKIERAYSSFAKKYKNNRKYLTDAKELKKVMQEREKHFELPRPMMYLHFSEDLDSTNTKIKSKINLFSERLRKAYNNITFYNVSFKDVTKANQKKFLKDPNLKEYKYLLENFFENTKYLLSEDEEKILNLKSGVSSSMWTQGREKSLHKKTITFKGEKLSLTEASSKLTKLNTKDRRKIRELLDNLLEETTDFAESEINALITNKKIEDNLRGYTYLLEERMKGDEMDKDVVFALRDAVAGNYSASKKFFRLKKKMTGLKDFYYVDRHAPVGKIKRKFSAEDSIKIFSNALEKMGGVYKDVFEEFLKNGQIDFFPRKGKRGGAYSWAAINTPIFVLLNHANDLRSLTTLAHEMGHSFHSYWTRVEQPKRYQNYVIPVAEVASTFFENLVFAEIWDTLTDKEKIVVLHDRINDAIATVHRQIAMFDYEIALHEKVRKEGYVDQEDMTKMMTQSLKEYMGSAISFSYKDGLFFASYPHLRYEFYVYSYAYGKLISDALWQRYQEDSSYLEKVEEFMKAGGSKPPYKIFKDIGIDTKDKKFWEYGLKKIENDIKELERLVKNS